MVDIMSRMAPRSAPPLPLSPAVLAILLSLAEGEKHGYLIMKEARKPKTGSLRMGPGTLYGTLDRLLRDGFVEESERPSNRRRHYYRLTTAGEGALRVELTRLGAALSSARALGLIAE